MPKWGHRFTTITTSKVAGLRGFKDDTPGEIVLYAQRGATTVGLWPFSGAELKPVQNHYTRKSSKGMRVS